MVVFFFFQAEDGIRDLTVTGVQTCALPICSRQSRSRSARPRRRTSGITATGAWISLARTASSPTSGTTADEGPAMADHDGQATAKRPVQALLPRQLALPWTALITVAAGAWAITVIWARTMGNGPGTMGLALLPFLGLWVLMMAAMMLPSVAPVAVLWTRLITGTTAGLGRA